MKSKLMVMLLFILLLGGSLAIAEPQEGGPTLRLARNAGVPDKYDLIMSDGDEAVVSGTFSKSQVETFRNILLEARKFASNEEEVGNQEPKTTRIASESEPAFIVDVTKLDDQSQIFITLTTDVGQLTIEAGNVQRRSKREQGVFISLLTRMQALLPAPVPAK